MPSIQYKLLVCFRTQHGDTKLQVKLQLRHLAHLEYETTGWDMGWKESRTNLQFQLVVFLYILVLKFLALPNMDDCCACTLFYST